jgi:hypothetical protein
MTQPSAQLRELINPDEIRGVNQKESLRVARAVESAAVLLRREGSEGPSSVSPFFHVSSKGLGAAGLEPRGAAFLSFAAHSGPAPGCPAGPRAGIRAFATVAWSDDL